MLHAKVFDIAIRPLLRGGWDSVVLVDWDRTVASVSARASHSNEPTVDWIYEDPTDANILSMV